MPLYKKRVKKTLLSQDASICSPFENFTKTQESVEAVLERNGEIRSPTYPEVFPRCASEPTESAIDCFKKNFQESIPSTTNLGISKENATITQNLGETEFDDLDNENGVVTSTSDENATEKAEEIKIPEKTDQSDEKNREAKKRKSDGNQKINLLDSKDGSNEDIFSQKSNKSIKKTSRRKDLDTSLNSSISSQVSINHPPVKEAFKNFLLQKETKEKECKFPTQNSDISLNDPIVRKSYSKFIEKNEKFRRVDTPKGLNHYDKMKWLQQQRIVGVYVYCDKCDKIRYLEEIQDPTLLPDKWYCKDNKDKKYNKCEIPEEKFPLHIQEDWINNLYNAGSIVWAKVEGFPWWPGMVEDDPDTESYYWLEDYIKNEPTYYHVTFFDKQEVTRAWLKPSEIKSFYKEKDNTSFLPSKFSKYKTRIDFAYKQASTALDMSLRERFDKFSFLSRYNKPINKPVEVKLTAKTQKSKFKKDNFLKKTRNEGEKNKKKRRKKNEDKELNFLMGDFEIPSSPLIENISLEIFGDL